MRLHGDRVAWWRVVRADGRPADCHGGTAVELLRAEGAPVRPDGRVVVPR
jgi:alkylated DNA nucleotide flippase Atl1